MGKYLTRAQVQVTVQGIHTEPLEVPEWGGTILIRELTTEEVTKLGVETVGITGTVTRETLPVEAIVSMLPQLVAWAAVDEELHPLFTLREVERMSARNLDVIQRIAEKTLEISGLTENVDEDGEATTDPN